MIVKNTSVPTKCTFSNTPAITHIAGLLYTLMIQSRDNYGAIIDATTDVYSILFTRSDGGGSLELTTTALYQAGGLYKA